MVVGVGDETYYNNYVIARNLQERDRNWSR